MHNLDLLINIAVAIVTAFIGGLVACRLGLPTIVCYLRRLDEVSPIVRRTLTEADLRARTGASVIAIIRAEQGHSWVVPNPKSSTRFHAGDLVGLIGDPAQIAALDAFLANPSEGAPDVLAPARDGREARVT